MPLSRRGTKRTTTRALILAAVLGGILLTLAAQEVRQLYFRVARLETGMELIYAAITGGH